MLHEKIQSTIGLIDEVMDNKEQENENQNLAKRNSTFFDTLDRLAPTLRSYILARKNFSFSLQTNTSSVLAYIMDYSNRTFSDAKAVNPSQFKDRSDTFIGAISKEWETFYRTNNSDLINGLNIIVLVHPTPNVVRSCITAFNKCEKWPLTQESIDSYKEARQKADALLKEMRFDDEIRDFLIKVRDKKATLTDITPSILDWIKSENIADKVSLSIRNTI
ncbi:MAG: hypothetical protein K6F71_10055 [Ruminococcus sp.]|uniref:hypothetical protein n=1 Tax=Ruminococcus sp. TaxID=41978 RepID=UPI0026003D07|nr:hypothetical protein [Ruminococcus sp.]MCR5541142.1 hypothetical protein [Ruminococcus sp.]